MIRGTGSNRHGALIERSEPGRDLAPSRHHASTGLLHSRTMARRRQTSAAAWALLDKAARDGVIDPGLLRYARDIHTVPLVSILESVGDAALRSGDDRRAGRLYRAALEHGSTNAGVPYNLGNVAMRAGRTREAITFYGQALELDPDLAVAHYNRGIQHRRAGAEDAARRDIATAIAKGYDGIEVYAALLRGRSAEFGAAAAALDRAATVLQLASAGDLDLAFTLLDIDIVLRRGTSLDDPRDATALAVSLETSRELLRAVGDVHGAAAAGIELVGVCTELADREPSPWTADLAPLRDFTVGQLPRRLVALIELHALVGRHDDALAAAAEAQGRCGGLASGHRELGPLHDAIGRAIWITLRRRAEAAIRQEDQSKSDSATS